MESGVTISSEMSQTQPRIQPTLRDTVGARAGRPEGQVLSHVLGRSGATGTGEEASGGLDSFTEPSPKNASKFQMWTRVLSSSTVLRLRGCGFSRRLLHPEPTYVSTHSASPRPGPCSSFLGVGCKLMPLLPVFAARTVGKGKPLEVNNNS